VTICRLLNFDRPAPSGGDDSFSSPVLLQCLGLSEFFFFIRPALIKASVIYPIYGCTFLMFCCFICVCIQLHPRTRQNQRTVHARCRRRTTANYRSLHVTPQVVNASTPLDVDAILNSLNDQIDHFNERGSGWILERVTRFELVITEYRPLCGGSSYIKTLRRIADKRAVVNVRNDKSGQEDQMCFIWAIQSCLHDKEVPLHKERLCH